jgi:hypothetical protein
MVFVFLHQSGYIFWVEHKHFLAGKIAEIIDLALIFIFV